MSNRVYFVRVNWLAQFAMAALFGLFALIVALAFIGAIIPDRTVTFHQRVWLFLAGAVCAPLFFYIAVGAARNGGRVMRAIWDNQYRWKE